MQQRIDHLEGLVKRLIAQRQEIPPDVGCSQASPKPEIGPVTTAVASDASDVACSAGTTVFDGVHSVYKGVNDWFDVLQEVSPFQFSFLPFLFSFSFIALLRIETSE